MEFVISLIIAGVVAFLVVQDATSLRDEEIAVLGGSNVSPGTWGTGVFLLLIVFLPAYMLTRISHNKQLILARPYPAEFMPSTARGRIAASGGCPHCGSSHPGSGLRCQWCHNTLVSDRDDQHPSSPGVPADSASPLDEIAKAHALLSDGAITPEEYAAIKAKALL